MVHVELDTILTEEDALQRIKEIFERVENDKVTYVITHNGKPSLAIVDIATLEQDGSGEPFHTPVKENILPVEPAAKMDTPIPITPISHDPEPSYSSQAAVEPEVAVTPNPSISFAQPVEAPAPVDSDMDLPPMPDTLAFTSAPSAKPSIASEPIAEEIPTAPAAPSAEESAPSPVVPTPPASSSNYSSSIEPETDLNNSSPLA